jgi:photosystem II stability/assembly factor-like uncharacterized protein
MIEAARLTNPCRQTAAAPAGPGPARRVIARVLCAVAIGVVAAMGPAAPTAAQERYLWRPVAIGAGGFISGFDADPTGATRVIRTDVFGAYLWIEAEKRWAQLVTASSMPQADRRQAGLAEGVYEIAVAPSRPERIYMAIKGHVYRSDTRGASFQRMSGAQPFPLTFDPNSPFRFYGPFLAVSPSNPDLVLFGTPRNGLLRSDNGGQNWQTVTSVPAAKGFRPPPGAQSPGVSIWFERGPQGAATGRIWAMSPGNGMFVSSDEGRSFVALSQPGSPQPTNLRRGAFAPDGSFFGVDPESRTVWRYRNDAWTDLTARPGLTQGRFAAVAVHPRSGHVFVFDEGGRAARSVDGGERWTRLSHSSRVGPGDPPWLRVANLSYFATGMVAFDPVTPDRMINTAGTGLYVADMPANASHIAWTSQTRGVEELVTNDVVDMPGRAPLFAAWDFGIHVKDDLNTFSTTYGPRERVLIAAQQLAWSERNPDFVVTNASDTRTHCCWQDGQAVLAGYSTDAGRTWTRFATLPHPAGTRADDPWRMAFGMIAVSSGDVDNIIWAPSYNRQPFYTKDRGRSWRPVVLQGEVGPNTGSHVHYHLPRKTLTADRVRSGVFYYYHAGDPPNQQLLGLWRTEDGGETWTKVFSREIAPQSRAAAKLRAVPGHAGHLFFTAGVMHGTDTRLRRSSDGGENWTVLTQLDNIDDIGFGKAAPVASYPTIYVSGRLSSVYGVWRSTDNAASWTRLAEFPIGTLDRVSVVEGDKDVFGRVYLGYQGSGWRYGEPSDCTPAPYRFPAESECFAAR